MLQIIKDFFTVHGVPNKPNTVNFYDTKLYLEDGTLFLEMEQVEVVHWSDNIYWFYDKNHNYLKKIHKGDNMFFIFNNKTTKVIPDEKE